ncbi:hypothetical protein NL676_006501 [Syzygium grande]|nr:hypothetical protein NL676_006501 [Syzygium grande]
MKAAGKLGLRASDPLYHYVLMAQFSLPPAMNIGTMTQLFDVGPEECSVLFLWTYLFADIALTFCDRRKVRMFLPWAAAEPFGLFSVSPVVSSGAIFDDESHDKDEHISSENDGGLGNGRSGDEGDRYLKALSNWKKRRESGKSSGSLDRKEEHVCSENGGRLGDRGSYDEGDPNLKMPPKMKKEHKSIASAASLDRKDEHVTSEIKGKLGSRRPNFRELVLGIIFKRRPTICSMKSD